MPIAEKIQFIKKPTNTMLFNPRDKFQKLSVLIFILVSLVVWYKLLMSNYSAYKFHKLTSEPSTKYILVWNLRKDDTNKTNPILRLGHGKQSFIKRKCPNVNCYVSFDRMLFGDVTKFDVIIFEPFSLRVYDLPMSRSPNQKYVLASMESSDNYPMCNKMFDGFFNWTWTYKLNSDVLFPYFIIRDSYGNVIGPKQNINWKRIEEMEPINDDLKKKLSKKRKAAAWFVSHCETRSKREIVVENLRREMLNYDLELDVYGFCSSQGCPHTEMAQCLKMLQEDYYFYLSFENSLTDDYVTEKVLNAVRNYVIPIVFGGANYTKFIPDGTYLDATKLKPNELAAKMNGLIMDKEQYYSYFKWHNHYSYHEPIDSPETDPYCNLCSTIHKKIHEKSEYKDFLTWWVVTPKKCLYQNYDSYLSLIYLLLNLVKH